MDVLDEWKKHEASNQATQVRLTCHADADNNAWAWQLLSIPLLRSACRAAERSAASLSTSHQRDRNDRVRPSGARLGVSARHIRSLAQGGREKPPHMVISRRNLVRFAPRKELEPD